MIDYYLINIKTIVYYNYCCVFLNLWKLSTKKYLLIILFINTINYVLYRWYKKWKTNFNKSSDINILNHTMNKCQKLLFEFTCFIKLESEYY